MSFENASRSVENRESEKARNFLALLRGSLERRYAGSDAGSVGSDIEKLTESAREFIGSDEFDIPEDPREERYVMEFVGSVLSDDSHAVPEETRERLDRAFSSEDVAEEGDDF